MNIYEGWTRYHIADEGILIHMEELFEHDKPTIGGFDTESSGLHIIKDKPFLYQFGWLIPNEEFGRVFTFYPTASNMTAFFELAGKLKWLVAWNTKFDLHMSMNGGYEYPHDNLVEGTAIARLCVEAVPILAGGDSLALKAIGVNYVHYLAGESERKIKRELEKLDSARVKVLTAALKQFPMEGVFTATGKQKMWGKGAIEDFLKDPTQDVEDLSQDVADVWTDWLEEYPPPTYEDIPREVMLEYAADDIITMLEYVKKALPIIKSREQELTLKRECKLIKPLFRMERVGIPCDRDYLLASRVKMKRYIITKRHELHEVAGEVITVGQHERIRQIYAEKWDIHVDSVDKKVLNTIKEKHEGDPKRLAELIGTLRRLEKWYSTYLNRILDSSSFDGRFYTQINQTSAVTGRVGSDAQQFPRERLLTELGTKLEKNGEVVPDEEELFCPRRVFTTSGNGYDKTVYIDYSQVELRAQADYTIRTSGGDLNMCRAYMPFKCHRWEESKTPFATIRNKVEYDYSTVESRMQWDRDDWYFDEEPTTKWSPTDVHSLTSHNALILLGYTCVERYKTYEYKMIGVPFFNRLIDSKTFKDVRFKGKTFNFMKNYGGGLRAAMDQLNLPETVAQALINGNEQAFPHVSIFQKKIVSQHAKKGYVQNMKGRRYYLQNMRISYKLANYVVQGTCADELKEAIILVDELLLPYKTRFQMNIHDELAFEMWNGEEFLIPMIKKIMEDVFSWCYVPIIAEVSYSDTNWYEKSDWKEEAA